MADADETKIETFRRSLGKFVKFMKDLSSDDKKVTKYVSGADQAHKLRELYHKAALLLLGMEFTKDL